MLFRRDFKLADVARDFVHVVHNKMGGNPENHDYFLSEATPVELTELKIHADILNKKNAKEGLTLGQDYLVIADIFAGLLERHLGGTPHKAEFLEELPKHMRDERVINKLEQAGAGTLSLFLKG